MSNLLDQALKDQAREGLRKSLETRLQQYKQGRDLAQAHRLVLEKIGEGDTADAKEAARMEADANVKIAAAEALLDELKLPEPKR